MNRFFRSHKNKERRRKAGGISGDGLTTSMNQQNVDTGKTGRGQHLACEGYLDYVEGSRVVGWAYDPKLPDRRLTIEITRGAERQRAVADIAREDLRIAQKGDGKHGFVADFTAPFNGSDDVRAHIIETEQELIGSPIRPGLAYLISQDSKIGTRRLLRAEIQSIDLNLPQLTDSAISTENANVSIGYQTRAKLSTLMETANSRYDVEGLVSKYLAYEIYRFKMDDQFIMDGDLHHRLRTVDWYLRDYGPRRGLQLPISSDQIKFMNSPVPILGLTTEISVAAYSFIKSELNNNINFNDLDAVRGAIYWWVTSRACALCPNGELITFAQERLLNYAGPEEVGTSFPLNYFARRFHMLNTAYHELDLGLAGDRAIFVLILVLKCAETPSLSKFLPRAAVSELLNIASGEKSPFEEIVNVALTDGAPGAFDVLSQTLFPRLENFLLTRGLSIKRASPRKSATVGSALALKENPAISNDLGDNVAVIGPTRATSGLGQATRLSIDVMKHIGENPAVLEFGLDNPAPTGFGSAVDPSNLKRPQKINLFHLNAEAIPLALAYLDKRIYDRSYNIGYFFWELSELPKCHALALETLDEIWVSSEYNKNIYSRNTNIPVINVGMAVEPLPKVPDGDRRVFDLDLKDFVFLSTFDSFSFVERKNPLGVVAAFQLAFPSERSENVVLILKTQNRSKVFDPHQVKIWNQLDRIIQDDPRIRIVDQTLSYRDLLHLKKSSDCYVSLHRSEGWGFGLIEAMQLGVPVICTGYSGNMEFCTQETAFIVGYDLITPGQAEYIFVEKGSLWADPRIKEAAVHMRHVYSDPASGGARAKAAQAFVASNFDVPSIGARYKDRLKKIRLKIMPARA